MTAHSMVGDRDHCLAAGWTTLRTKPPAGAAQSSLDAARLEELRELGAPVLARLTRGVPRTGAGERPPGDGGCRGSGWVGGAPQCSQAQGQRAGGRRRPARREVRTPCGHGRRGAPRRGGGSGAGARGGWSTRRAWRSIRKSEAGHRPRRPARRPPVTRARSAACRGRGRPPRRPPGRRPRAPGWRDRR